jgi:hypothetical protein
LRKLRFQILKSQAKGKKTRGKFRIKKTNQMMTQGRKMMVKNRRAKRNLNQNPKKRKPRMMIRMRIKIRKMKKNPKRGRKRRRKPSKRSN